MKKILLPILFVVTAACSKDDSASSGGPVQSPDTFLRCADLSFLPEIEAEGTLYYDNATAADALTILKNHGANAVRIRLWKDPAGGHSGFNEVRQFAQRVHNAGLKVWLTVHFSDSWADPGNQTVPTAWSALDYNGLKQAVSEYTSQILTEIQPEVFQIGNETNDGFLWPIGKLSTNPSQCVGLMDAVSDRIREESPSTKIMLHYAGINGATWFFSQTTAVDYDYIGLSYYPVWHGTSLTPLQNLVSGLGTSYGKKVLIAETAYPFTLDWDDWTNNIVGLESQLVPAYPATPQGQKDFMMAVRQLITTDAHGLGFSYWGGEWLAFRGPEATNGSTFENQALFDFDHNALPVLEAFAP